MDKEKQQLHRRKMVAPILIAVLLVIYYIVYFGGLIFLVQGIAALLLGIIPLALGGTTIYVCVQRIQEIRSGEEDDLSQY